MFCILYHATANEWLHFEAPRHIIQAQSLDDVLPAFAEIARSVQQDKLYAAGFVSYEAAPAFDPALHAHTPDNFPLLCFGLYEPPRRLTQLPPYADNHLGEWQPTISRDEYRQAIAQIKEHIARGNTYQVNYTFRLHAAFTGSAWGLFRAMQEAQPTPYAAYIDWGRYALCSASPELFFHLDEETLTCRPMKGTAARGKTLDEDRQQSNWLHHSEKNRAENVMIVDMIRNDLGRIARTGSVQVASLFETERYPSLWQMTSTITARSQAGLAEIFTALFPCASITGAPKVSTSRLIAYLENTPRHIYTGSIGFITPEMQMQFNVAIRTAVVDRQRQQAEYGIGSGIVWDSIPSDEYEECLMKANFVQPDRLADTGRGNTNYPPFSLFESLLWTPEDSYFLLAYHFKRMCASAQYFDYPFDQALAEANLNHLAAGLPAEGHKVRLLLHRDGRFECQAKPLSALHKPDPARVRLALTCVQSSDVFLYHKTTHRQAYQAAEAACPDCDEVILWNERGEITEAGTANVVLALDGKLVTPPVACGLLAGTFRAFLLAKGEIHEQVIPLSSLEQCEKIYLINSVRKWREAIL